MPTPKNKLLILALLFISLDAPAQERYTLQEALRVTRSKSPVLRTERYGIEFARSDVTTAKLRLNPRIGNESIQLMDRSERAPDTRFSSPQNREVFWHLTQPFQWAGQRKNTIAVANKGLLYSQEHYSDVERELFLEVAQKWLDVWTTQKQLEIIRIAKANIDSLLEINQRRYQNQVITQTDLFRTELLARQYAIEYNTAKQEVLNEQKELGLRMGVAEAVQVDTSTSFLFGMPIDLDSIRSRSLTERSDIRAVKQLIEVSESNIELQRSLAVPQPEVGIIYNPMNAIPYVGFSFGIDLPVHDRNQGERSRAVQLNEQAQSRLITLQEQVETEVSVAHANFLLQQRNSAHFQALLLQSETILENVRQTYLMGGTTIIDFLEAQRSWLETRQQYYETQQAFIDSYIRFMYATGLIGQLALPNE